jgi:hypothetical protein
MEEEVDHAVVDIVLAFVLAFMARVEKEKRWMSIGYLLLAIWAMYEALRALHLI